MKQLIATLAFAALIVPGAAFAQTATPTTATLEVQIQVLEHEIAVLMQNSVATSTEATTTPVVATTTVDNGGDGDAILSEACTFTNYKYVDNGIHCLGVPRAK